MCLPYAYLLGLAASLDALEGQEKLSIHRRVLGRVALAAVSALAVADWNAPSGCPYRYGQQLGPSLPPMDAVAGLLVVILLPERNQ